MAFHGNSSNQSSSHRGVFFGNTGSVGLTFSADINDIDSSNVASKNPIDSYSMHFVDVWRTSDIENDLSNRIH